MNIKAITHFFYRLFKARPSGLLPTPKDDRDFQTGIFHWFGYVPKHKRHVNQTISIKNQKNLNTCQWQATIAAKEPDERRELNVRVFVSKGQRMGLVSGDGYSNLRSGQKVLAEWGVPPKEVVSEDYVNWSDYIGINPDLYTNQARNHRISSYWAVSTRNDLLKLLDDGRIITTGIMWYTGFNRGGGFSSPWIISGTSGLKVGGHAIAIKGYDMDYHGKKVYVCQNSYGDGWGDNGDFYVEMDYMDRSHYGYFVNLDEIDSEMGKLITEHDGKNVKGIGHPAIYHIQRGVKKPYPNWESYLAWNGKARGFNEVDKSVLDRVPEGDIMDIKKTDYWTFLKDVKESNRLEAMLELLSKDN